MVIPEFLQYFPLILGYSTVTAAAAAAGNIVHLFQMIFASKWKSFHEQRMASEEYDIVIQ